MKILSVMSITFLIILAAGCDEVQNQVMKPVTMPGDEVPTADSVATSVGTMKDPSVETDDSKENTPAETDTAKADTDDAPQTMEADLPDAPQTPVAVFVGATPASGDDISENDSITIEFDNDPGEVTAAPWTVTGSGNARIINGTFPVGSLTLTISWTNGSGSKTLHYSVMGIESTPSPHGTVSNSPSDGAVDVDTETQIPTETVQQPAEPEPEPEPALLDPGEGLSIGAEAPDFTLLDGHGNTYALSDFSGKVVIVFYRGGW